MKILIVDDDTSVIQSLLATIKTLPGHEVRAATSGGKALENAATLGGIDLLITDVVMEPMDGFALRDEMKTRYPALRTILVSGYDLSEYAEQMNGCAFLQKPFEPAAVLALLEKEIVPSAPKPVAQPRVAAVPMPTAVARESGRIVPQARAVAQTKTVAPKAVAPKAVAAAPAAVAMSIPALDTKPGEFTGHTIGAYEVQNQMGSDEWGDTYMAVQTAINRPVGLHILSAERAADEASGLRFIADARAKANVQHPAILAVYEAGDSEGRIFYAHEYVDGQTLAQLAEHGQKINEKTTIAILKTTAEGIAYLNSNKIPHLPLDGTRVQLGTDGQPRLANLAVQIADRQPTEPEEIVALGRALFGIIHTGPLSPLLRGLLGRMVQAEESGLPDWPAVIEAVKEVEPKNVPAHVAAIGEQDRKAAAALEAARKQQKRELVRNIASVISFVALAGFVVWYVMRNRAHVVEEWIAIPAGTYTMGQTKVTLPKFSISKYEVTIGQYAAFLKYLDDHPANSKDFDHERQPRHVSHQPKDWAIYHGQARKGGAVAGAPYSMDSPMVMVTWWDAYAYAKWRGQQLPTEQQWEAAARGAEGFIYPWGNDRDDKKVNSGADYVKTDTKAKGKVDGWNWWSPVDKVRGDKSPAGVIGMAGNVSEWVDGWTADKRFPIVKGGNFMSADVRLDKRVDNQDGGKGSDTIGFRTVTSN